MVTAIIKKQYYFGK